jgi:hypothetical protein
MFSFTKMNDWMPNALSVINISAVHPRVAEANNLNQKDGFPNMWDMLGPFC